MGGTTAVEQQQVIFRRMIIFKRFFNLKVASFTFEKLYYRMTSKIIDPYSSILKLHIVNTK